MKVINVRLRGTPSMQLRRLVLACATNTGEGASGAISMMGVWPPEAGL